MDVRERLSDTGAARGEYLAAASVHRYALAAELCAGMRVLDLGCGSGRGAEILTAQAASVHGVDVDASAVAAARRERAGATFTVADALEFLRAAGGGDFEAVVMFDALEHVADPDAVLDELGRLAAAGVRIAVSAPNSRAFGDALGVTEFGYAEARGAFARLGSVTLLHQVLAEGSLIVGDNARPEDLRARVGALEQAEPEYANAFIALAGFDAEAASTATAELNLVATPSHSRYMLELERANETLARTNRELARGNYGKHDAAAAVTVARHEEAQRRIGELERHVAEVEAALHQEWAWRDAGRYRAVDRAMEATKRIPGLSALLRAVRRAVRLVSGGGGER